MIERHRGGIAVYCRQENKIAPGFVGIGGLSRQVPA
jgi:hypothetical protein